MNESSNTIAPAAIKITPAALKGHPRDTASPPDREIHHGTSPATMPGARTRNTADPSTAAAFLTFILRTQRFAKAGPKNRQGVRLRDKVVHAGCDALLAISIHLGHLAVHQDQVVIDVRGGLDCFGAIDHVIG